MTGLFCFDGPLFKDKDGEYCSTTLTNEMFNRFFSVVDKLVLVIRCTNTNKTSNELNMKRLDTSRIEIITVDNLVSIKGLLVKKKAFEKKIESRIKRVDLIFARMPSVISDSVLKIAQKLGKPYLVEVGGCAWDSYWNHGLKGKIVAPLMFFWERKYVRDAQFATYVTKNFLQERYPTNAVSTNCSNVYLESVSEDILEDRLRKISALQNHALVLGQAVASIDVRYKGEHLIIRAMSELKKKGILLEYQIVGPGDGGFIKAQAQKYNVMNQVVFLGAKKKEEIFQWLREIDVYAQPSKQEGLPRSVIEAMSVGCPSIGSNIAGIPELLDFECLFNPNSISDIVKSLEYIMDKDIMAEQAKINFYRAREYQLEIIEQRRQHIFVDYRDYVMESNKK